MSRNRSLMGLVACVLLPATLSLACREKAAETERAAADPTPGTYVGPLDGAEWTGDPPAVAGSADPLELAAAADRERLIAEREAAVAEREAEVARREAALGSAPRRSASTSRSSTTRASAPRPAPPPEPVRQAQRDYEPEPEPRREPVRRATSVTVPAGTTISAEMIGGVSSDTAQVGDSVSARVTENVYAGGELAIPAGSTLHGSVTTARGLRRVGGRAQLALRFDTVDLRSGADAPVYATWERLGAARRAATRPRSAAAPWAAPSWAGCSSASCPATATATRPRARQWAPRWAP